MVFTKGKVKAHPSQRPKRTESCLGILLLPPWMGCLFIAGLPPPPSSMSPVPMHLYTWVKTRRSKEPCLMKPGPRDSEFEALTGPPHTPSHRQMKPCDQNAQAFVLTPSHPSLDPPPGGSIYSSAINNLF